MPFVLNARFNIFPLFAVQNQNNFNKKTGRKRPVLWIVVFSREVPVFFDIIIFTTSSCIRSYFLIPFWTSARPAGGHTSELSRTDAFGSCTAAHESRMDIKGGQSPLMQNSHPAAAAELSRRNRRPSGEEADEILRIAVSQRPCDL